MVPLTSFGAIGSISSPRSMTKDVWLYDIVGLPLRTRNETLNWLFPRAVSFIHRVNSDSDMLLVAVPETRPVSELMLKPSGRAVDPQESRYSSQ